MSDPSTASAPSRRQFMMSSGGVVAAAALSRPAMFVHGGGTGEIRVGLIGCGGRGTGAAVNALTVEPRARLVAMGDVFADHIEQRLGALSRSAVSSQIAVDPEHRFVGFDAYEKVIATCDVVLLASTPHFRPRHLAAAIDAGKHVFCEKPIAVDAPGVRSVMETAKRARDRDLNLVSGLCYRYQDAKQETIQRIHDGALGDILTLQTTYNAGGLWHRGREEDWSDMEWQIRNWLYFNWLSGDHITEQSIHSLDKALWAMGDRPPAKVTASGGRIVRTDPKYGNIYDHFNCVYEWEDGPRLFHSCRQWANADTDVSDYVFGTEGIAGIQHHYIKGKNAWRFRGRPNDMYESEMRALFTALENNDPINNGDYMCKSTLLAIMGRMSAYTGKTIGWQEALESRDDMTPPEYAWGPVNTAPVARPGITQFV